MDMAYIYTPDGAVGTGIIFNQPGWYDSTGYYYFFKDYTRVDITNMGDPLNNYKVYTSLDPITGLPGAWRLIKSVP